jgi:hypothetical protein
MEPLLSICYKFVHIQAEKERLGIKDYKINPS